MVAHDLLAKTAMWWEPGYVKTLHKGEERPLQPIYFRISISERSAIKAFPPLSALTGSTASTMSAKVAWCREG
jgi:hypothetical protein